MAAVRTAKVVHGRLALLPEVSPRLAKQLASATPTERPYLEALVVTLLVQDGPVLAAVGPKARPPTCAVYAVHSVPTPGVQPGVWP